MARKKSAAKKSSPKFGSPAWFAKYPKAGRVAGKKKKKK